MLFKLAIRLAPTVLPVILQLEEYYIMINFIQIDPNGLCNAGCWFCPVSLVGNPKEHISQMLPELYENIIKQIHELKGDLINPNLHFVLIILNP